MQNSNRRQLLESLGIAAAMGAAGALLPMGTLRAADAAPTGDAAMAAWQWQPLDPQDTAQQAYDIYPNGSCMYAVFGGVMTALAAKYGAPYNTFPIGMMRYGAEGAFYGSLCGAANGAAALIGLFCPSMEQKSRREKMIHEVFAWYEAAKFPGWVPAKPALDVELPRSAAGSVLCHLSMGLWSRAAGKTVGSPERKERCRRLSAETTARVTELLNRAVDPQCAFSGLPTATTNCTLCHSMEGTRPDSMTRMRCDACHVIRKEHPTE